MNRICDKCNHLPAEIHYKETVNGKTEEWYLCAECAAKMGIGAQPSVFSDGFFSPFSLFSAPPKAESAETHRCPVCGTELSRIQREGVFGCAACYDSFGGKLDLSPFVGRGYHDPSVRATEKEACEKAKTEDSVCALRERLQTALKEENYEEAARLRDRIREKEGL